jgi:arsenite oxidase small subunit
MSESKSQGPRVPARRIFLKTSGASAFGVTGAVVAGTAGAAPADDRRTTLPYPRRVVATAAAMTVGTAFNFNYPDPASPCIAVKLGRRAAGGVGPDGDIVAYSALCTHMGCPVSFDGASNVFKCGCHFSMFDAEKSGQMICGQATENLPRLTLEFDAKTGAVSATGIDGLIYGRASNIL